MKITKRGDYAGQAILDLINNSNGKAVRLKDIADRQSISLFFLEQIFRDLRKAGVVRSVRGPGGGYILVETPAATSVLNVLKGAREVLDFGYIYNPDQNPTKEHLAMLKLQKELTSAVMGVLNKSLSQVLGE